MTPMIPSIRLQSSILAAVLRFNYTIAITMAMVAENARALNIREMNNLEVGTIYQFCVGAYDTLMSREYLGFKLVPWSSPFTGFLPKKSYGTYLRISAQKRWYLPKYVILFVHNFP